MVTNLKKQKQPIVFFLIVLATAAALFFFSSQDRTETNRLSGSIARQILTFLGVEPSGATWQTVHWVIRKSAHFFLFSLLGSGIMGIVCFYRKKQPFLLAVPIGVLLAAADELHQLFASGRFANVRDVVLDGAGVLFGCALTYAFLRRKSRKDRKDRQP